jgi:catechol-2,3-dioxygenase
VLATLRRVADEPIPRIRQVVLDTTDVRGLAEFYRNLVGYDYRPGDREAEPGEDWLVLRHPDGGQALAFQLVDRLPTSTWPEDGIPQQLHLDMTVPDKATLEAARDRALGLGATLRHDRFDDEQEPLYVFADPAGHPFCIFVSTH